MDERELQQTVAAPARGRFEFGFWVVAFTYVVVMAVTTAPSPLYGLYQQRQCSPSTAQVLSMLLDCRTRGAPRASPAGSRNPRRAPGPGSREVAARAAGHFRSL